jgi:hypothetical protein
MPVHYLKDEFYIINIAVDRGSKGVMNSISGEKCGMVLVTVDGM